MENSSQKCSNSKVFLQKVSTLFYFIKTILGCIFHACRSCHGDKIKEFHPIQRGKTWNQIRVEEEARFRKIRAHGFQLEVKYECELKMERAADAEMDDFFKEWNDSKKGQEPIFSPREGPVIKCLWSLKICL